MNIVQARTNMIKQQLRTWHVLDPSIIDLVANTPREQFVPKGYEQLAFADTAIPLGDGRSMMSPKEEARIVQDLNIQPTNTVLLIGADGAYLLTLLAKLSSQVFVAEKDQSIVAGLEKHLASHNISNVHFLSADINGGWEQSAPYDAIVLSGSVDELGQNVLDGISVGGRLFAVVGNEPVMNATIFIKDDQSAVQEKILYDTIRPRVPSFKERGSFTF